MSLRGTKLPIWNVRITLFQLDPSALAPCTDGLFSSGGITTIEDRMAKDWGNGLQAHLAANRSQFYRDLPEGPFYGYNQPGAKASEAVIANWWRQGMMGGAKAHYDGIVAFSWTDFTDDLKKIIVPVLVAALAASAAGNPLARMTATGRPASSAAIAGSRLYWPSDQRYSIAKLRPSAKDASFKPWRKPAN